MLDRMMFEQGNKRVMEYFRDKNLTFQFDIGAYSVNKLKRALLAIKRTDLIDRTLLTPEIHKVHAGNLSKRFLNKWDKLRVQKQGNWRKSAKYFHLKLPPTEHNIAADYMRFFTLIDSVCAVDAATALKQALILKNELIQCVKRCKGMWCLGGIEGEIISISKLRDIRDGDLDIGKDNVKLDSSELLYADMDCESDGVETSLFSIHFHGLLIAKKTNQFDDFNIILRENPRWIRAQRQIRITKLSESWGESKSVKLSLTHIATYITKGGNDWSGNRSYFRYKIKIGDVNNNYASRVISNWRMNNMNAQHLSEDAKTDLLSMTVNEIAQQVVFIDGLMSSNNTRTGYLVSVCS